MDDLPTRFPADRGDEIPPDAREWIRIRAERLADATPELRERYLRALARLRPELAGALDETLGEASIESAQKSFGPFRTVRRLGGGQVEVWLAVDERTDTPVVLKTSTDDGSIGSDRPESIERERDAGLCLDVPGVPRILEAGCMGGSRYLIREFVPGTPMSEWIAQRRAERPLGIEPDTTEVREIVGCMARAARVVAGLHDAGWIHGDLKPGNLLVGVDGLAHVVDLGCATRLGRDLCSSGTPAYAAPERLSDPSPKATAAIDVWALGVALFECIALRLPFCAVDRDSLLLEVLSAPLPETVDHLAWSVPQVGMVIRWALDRDPDRRCPSAIAFARDLERALSGAPTHASRLHRRRRHWRTTLWIACIALLCAATSRIGTTGRSGDAELSRLLSTTRWLDLATRDADRIWPAWPENLGRIEEWLGRHAAPLQARREALLCAIGDAVGRERESLQTECEAISQFLDPVLGVVAEMQRRLAIARSIESTTVHDHSSEWVAAASRVDADARFTGFRLRPLVGLEPLGPDPRSGLEEFHDLASAAPGHAPPTRDAEGRLVLEDQHGIVFVLVPGVTTAVGEQKVDPSAPNFDPVAADFAAPETLTLAPFLLSKFELTNGQWSRLSGGSPPSYFRPGVCYGSDPAITDRHPVEQVSWFEARRVLARGGMDLPTEAQWECVARSGGEPGPTGGGDPNVVPHHENFRAPRTTQQTGSGSVPVVDSDGFEFTAPVGSFDANHLGFHDLLGNVAEWCRDAWGPHGPDNGPRPIDGLRKPESRHRTYRGGTYAHRPEDCRAGLRLDDVPDRRTPMIGVRPMRPVPESDE